MSSGVSRRCAWGRRARALLLTAVAGATAFGCSSVPRRLAAPQAQLLGIDLVQASFEGQRFSVSLLLANPNSVAIPVRQVDFDVRLGGEGILEGRSVAPFTLPAEGSETIELEVFSNIVSSATRLLSLVQGPRNVLDYELAGELALDIGMREPLGFYSRGQVPLTIAE